MRPSLEIAGMLALAAALILSGPGVKVVRAQEPLVSAAPSAPSCSADPEAGGIDLEALKQQLRLREQEAPGEPVIVLNTRGYGYAPGAGLEQIRDELRRVQRESR